MKILKTSRRISKISPWILDWTRGGTPERMLEVCCQYSTEIFWFSFFIYQLALWLIFVFKLEEYALPGTKNFVELQKLEKLQPSELNPKSGFPLHQNRNFRFSELNMLVRFGYQTHLDFRPQPNCRPDGFQVTNPRILMLLPEPNSSFFFILREANRKCEPKFNLWPVISSEISSGISVSDAFGESSMCGQQTRTPVRGLSYDATLAIGRGYGVP